MRILISIFISLNVREPPSQLMKPQASRIKLTRNFVNLIFTKIVYQLYHVCVLKYQPGYCVENEFQVEKVEKGYKEDVTQWWQRIKIKCVHLK